VPAATDHIEVSVLIPVLNEEANLRGAAAAMLAQDLSGQAEFLFIDGGSDDASVSILHDLAAADQRVRVLLNPARRTPHALNIGLRAARGEFVARMDAHTLYPQRYLAEGVARLRRGGVDWVSGPQLAVGTDPGSARVARALSASLGKGGARFRDALESEHEVDSGFTGVWRRATLERHGGWDEEWVNDQDLELAARIRKGGGRIVCVPQMAAHYVPRSTLPALARQYLTYGTYRVKTAQRHPETLRRSQLLPPLVTVAAGAAVGAPWSRARRWARLATLVYVAALIAAAARTGEESRGADLLGLPVVWVTMHTSYGLGFLRGCARYGVPLAAMGHIGGVVPEPTSRRPQSHTS
jgi:cellulose synthase/poly-beta-1,6-N-acetylglucosamine synthase-like glycosyltransferase